jgi:hypothetical protein
MAGRSFEDEERNVEIAAEMSIEEDDARKDLKEKRGIIKRILYHGSNKLKHMIPKGKHL